MKTFLSISMLILIGSIITLGLDAKIASAIPGGDNPRIYHNNDSGKAFFSLLSYLPISCEEKNLKNFAIKECKPDQFTPLPPAPSPPLSQDPIPYQPDNRCVSGGSVEEETLKTTVQGYQHALQDFQTALKLYGVDSPLTKELYKQSKAAWSIAHEAALECGMKCLHVKGDTHPGACLTTCCGADVGPQSFDSQGTCFGRMSC